MEDDFANTSLSLTPAFCVKIDHQHHAGGEYFNMISRNSPGSPAPACLSPFQAAAGILVAYTSNLVFKLAMIGVIGTRQMFNSTLLCFSCLALPALLILI